MRKTCVVYCRTVLWRVEVFCLISKLWSWLHAHTVTLLITAWWTKHVGISSCGCWWHERRTIHIWVLSRCVVFFCLFYHLLPIHSSVLCRFASLFRLASVFSNLYFICESNRSIRRDNLISFCRWFLLLLCSPRFMDFVCRFSHSLHTCLIVLRQSFRIRTWLSIILNVCKVMLIFLHTAFLWWKVLHVDSSWLFIDMVVVSKASFSLPHSHVLRWWFNCISGIVSLIVSFINFLINCGGHQFVVNLIITRTRSSAVSFPWHMSDRIQNHIRLYRCQCLYEFLEANFSISVQVESSHDCN